MHLVEISMTVLLKEFRDSSFKRSEVLSLTLPYNQDFPTQGSKRPNIAPIPFSVPLYLLSPELRIRLRNRCAPAGFVTVPKASIYKHQGLVLRQHYIWFARNTGEMKSETISKIVKQTPNQHLDTCIFSLDVRHYFAALFCIKGIFAQLNLPRSNE